MHFTPVELELHPIHAPRLLNPQDLLVEGPVVHPASSVEDPRRGYQQTEPSQKPLKSPTRNPDEPKLVAGALSVAIHNILGDRLKKVIPITRSRRRPPQKSPEYRQIVRIPGRPNERLGTILDRVLEKSA
jgi:hypothetical protein